MWTIVEDDGLQIRAYITTVSEMDAFIESLEKSKAKLGDINEPGIPAVPASTTACGND